MVPTLGSILFRKGEIRKADAQTLLHTAVLTGEVQGGAGRR